MKSDLKNPPNRKFSFLQKLMATALLAALLSFVYAPGFSFAVRQAPAGMIYCPLAKNFQPINPPKEKKAPFSDLCASRETKDFLIAEIFVKNHFRKTALDQNALDEMAFDFLAHGKSALEKLPNLPDFPSENFVKQIGAAVAAGSAQDYKFVWKSPAQTNLPTLLPRPPTAEKSFFSATVSFRLSNAFSRQLAPRAPPFLS